MKVLGRFLLATGAGMLVLVVGFLAAMVLGGFAVLERNASPGNTFLILEFIAIAVLICVPMAIAVSCWVLMRTRNSHPSLAQDRDGLFLGRTTLLHKVPYEKLR